MSLGPVLIDLEGCELTEEERELLLHPAVGGVIFFQRNFSDAEQISRITREIHELRQPPLLVAVDQEGGRVQRFRNGFTELPPAAWYGHLYRDNAVKARKIAELAGWLMAVELRSVGVDFSFAPVLDLGLDISTVIGDRAMERRPMVVAELAQAWMKGAHQAGMAAVGKHFPGHGHVKADSHHELPVDERRLEDILMEDVIPFERLIHAGLEAIMPAHVIYQRVDGQAAGFSSYWLRNILRQQLGFQGVIFSDDLNMAAAHAGGDYINRARLALAAGCDLILVCNNRPAAEAVLDALEDYNDPASHLRAMRMHGRKKISRDAIHLDPRWKEAVSRLAEYQNRGIMDLDL